MPTLEDAIEFQAPTLNDLLDADAKAVALPSEGEGKYRSWAYISTAAAGLLAILLVVTLVTGGRGGDGGSTQAKAKTFPGRDIHRTLRLTEPPSSLNPGQEVSVYKNGVVVLAPVGLARIIEPKGGSTVVWSAELAMNKDEAALYNKAFAASTDRGTIQAYAGETVPTGPAPAATESTTPTTATPASTPPSTG